MGMIQERGDIKGTGQKGDVESKKKNLWVGRQSKWIGLRQEDTLCFIVTGEKDEMDTDAGMIVDFVVER